MKSYVLFLYRRQIDKREKQSWMESGEHDACPPPTHPTMYMPPLPGDASGSSSLPEFRAKSEDQGNSDGRESCTVSSHALEMSAPRSYLQ